jgi:hypothetical protein
MEFGRHCKTVPVGLQAPECDFRHFSNIVYVLFDFFLSDFNATFSIGETHLCAD